MVSGHDGSSKKGARVSTLQPKSGHPLTGRCSPAEATGGTTGAAAAVATAAVVAEA